MKIERSVAIDLFGTAALAIVLFQIDIFYAMFAVPLHVLAYKRRDHIFYYATALTALVVGIQEIVRFSSLDIEGQVALLGAISAYAPASVLAGTVIYHWLDGRGLRRLYRFLYSLSFAAVAGVLLVLVFEGDSAPAVQGKETLREQFDLLMQFGGVQSAAGGMFTESQIDALYRLTVATLKRSFLLGAAVQLGISIYIGRQIHIRRSLAQDSWFAGFKVPEVFVWPFMISWAVVLLSQITSLGFLEIIAWNAGLVIGFIYFFQGAAILSFLVRKRGMRLTPGIMVLLFAVLLFIPGVNIVLVVGIPLLGISEIWIRYRVVNKENTDENNS
ncbi:MAG: DUF2232 domain-containing protein [Spirochaetota bacterium]